MRNLKDTRSWVFYDYDPNTGILDLTITDAEKNPILTVTLTREKAQEVLRKLDNVSLSGLTLSGERGEQ